MMSGKMNLVVVLALICSVAYVQSQMVGGLHDEKQADDEIRAVVQKVKGDVEKMHGKSLKTIDPITYRTQVVAGRNYFVKALATESSGAKVLMHLRVYKPFKGDLELTAIRANVEESLPLKYFQ